VDGAFLLVTGAILVGLVSVGISTVRGERAVLLRVTGWSKLGAVALGLDGKPYQEPGAVRVRGVFEGRPAWSRATRDTLELGVVLDEALHPDVRVLPSAEDGSWQSSPTGLQDRAFAREMVTQGPPPALLALLSARARRGLAAANAGPRGPRFGIADRALVMRMEPPESAQALEAPLRAFTELCARLPPGVGHVARGLEARVRDAEELEGVRIQALKLLMHRAPLASETEAARQVALASEQPRLAATARGATGGEGGRLSLAAGPEGGLSVAEGEAGAVSEATAQGGLSEVGEDG